MTGMVHTGAMKKYTTKFGLRNPAKFAQKLQPRIQQEVSQKRSRKSSKESFRFLISWFVSLCYLSSASLIFYLMSSKHKNCIQHAAQVEHSKWRKIQNMNGDRPVPQGYRSDELLQVWSKQYKYSVTPEMTCYYMSVETEKTRNEWTAKKKQTIFFDRNGGKVNGVS